MRSGTSHIIIATACILAATAAPSRALAQHVAPVVNGEVITDYDIDQRTRFQTLSTHKTPSRQDVIEELIEEKLKVQISRRYKIDITDSEVESIYADMAKRTHLTPDQLTQTLTQGGVDPKTLKARIRADTAWQYIIRGKFQSSLQAETPEKGEMRERMINEMLRAKVRSTIKHVPGPIFID